MDMHDITVQIDEPDLHNAGMTVARDLHGAVGIRRRVRHFDQKEDIGGSRQLCAVFVRARRKDGHIRIQLGPLTQLNRILDTDDSLSAQLLSQQRGQPHDTEGMPWSDRRHFNDVAIDEFDAIVFRQNARVCHPVKLVHAEGSTAKWESHKNVDEGRIPSWCKDVNWKTHPSPSPGDG